MKRVAKKALFLLAKLLRMKTGDKKFQNKSLRKVRFTDGFKTQKRDHRGALLSKQKKTQKF
jgi:hypothetical protein